MSAESISCPICTGGRPLRPDECSFGCTFSMSQENVLDVFLTLLEKIFLPAREATPRFQACVHSSFFVKDAARLTMYFPVDQAENIGRIFKACREDPVIGGIVQCIAVILLREGKFEDITHVEL